jgi:hypothetical protein
MGGAYPGGIAPAPVTIRGGDRLPPPPAVYFVWLNSMNTRGPRGVSN